jgi:hypothetical protein
LLVNPFFKRSLHDDVASTGAVAAEVGPAGAKLLALDPIGAPASVFVASDVNAVVPPALIGVVGLAPAVSCAKVGPAPELLRTGGETFPGWMPVLSPVDNEAFDVFKPGVKSRFEGVFPTFEVSGMDSRSFGEGPEVTFDVVGDPNVELNGVPAVRSDGLGPVSVVGAVEVGGETGVALRSALGAVGPPPLPLVLSPELSPPVSSPITSSSKVRSI